jgi:VanZ family protein
MDIARPRWSYLLFPQLAVIALVTFLAATNNLRFEFLRVAGVDKLAHFALYGLLAFFSVGFFGRARWWRIAGVLAVLAAFEEYSQSFFPARTFDFGDLAATVAGIVLFARAAGPADRRED